MLSGYVEISAIDRPARYAVQSVNNETGVIQPLSEVAGAVRAAGGTLFADCSQSAGKLPLPDADLIAVSAHKLGGPPGIGALLTRNLGLLRPTGGQEQGYRRGTENLPAAIGLRWLWKRASVGYRKRRGFDRYWTMQLRALAAKLSPANSARACHHRQLPNAGNGRIEPAYQFRHGGNCGVGGQCLFVWDAQDQSCAGRNGLGCKGGFRGHPGELWSRNERSRNRPLPRSLAKHRRTGKGGMIYLDYQATTPSRPKTFAAMEPWLQEISPIRTVRMRQDERRRRRSRWRGSRWRRCYLRAGG